MSKLHFILCQIFFYLLVLYIYFVIFSICSIYYFFIYSNVFTCYRLGTFCFTTEISYFLKMLHLDGEIYQICVATPSCAVLMLSFHESEVVILLSCPSLSKCLTFLQQQLSLDCCCPLHCIFTSHCCENKKEQNKQKKKQCKKAYSAEM